MNSVLNWFIKSDFVKAQILAVVRHIVTAAGAALVAKGYADDSVVQGALGLATTVVGFWLANLDVKTVDNKIAVALSSTPTVDNTPSPSTLSEKEQTRLLNLAQHQGRDTPSAK